MQDMSADELRQWAATVVFKTTDNMDEIDTNYIKDGDGDEEIAESSGWVWRSSTALLDDGTEVEIKCQKMVSWKGFSTTRYDDDFEVYDMDGHAELLIEGVNLVDDDGDELGICETYEVLAEICNQYGLRIYESDIEPLIPDVTTEDIDLESDMEEFTVERDGDQNIRFKGEELAQAHNKKTYNGGGRWTVLKLWRTAGGKLICQRIGRTQWDGEVDRCSAAICSSDAEVIAFFGHDKLAKELYDEAGIDADLVVD